MSEEELRKNVEAELSKLKVEELPPADKEVVVITSDLSLADAFQVLLDSNIQSAPVEKKQGSGYAGVLDIRALASSVVSMHQSSQSNPELGDWVSKLEKEGSDHMSVWTPEYIARINPLKTVNEGDNILDVCQVLAQGTRRVAVISDNKATRVISQSWVAGRVGEVINELGTKATINDLGIGPKEVMGVTSSDAVFKAFELMDKHKIAGVPVYNEQGNLVGQVTSKDLHRFLKNRDVTSLDTTCEKFLENGLGEDVGKSIVVTANTLVKDLFQLYGKSHRVFLVEEDKVVGVISLKDALAAVLTQSNE